MSGPFDEPPSDPPPPAPVVAMAPEEAAVVAPVARFCGRCGGLLELTTGGCPACLAKATATAMPHAGVTAGEGTSGGSVGRAVGLYFAMLAVSVATLIAGMLEVDELSLDIFALVALSLVVGVASGIYWRQLLPVLRTVAHPLWIVTGMGIGIATFAVVMGVIQLLTATLDVPILRYSEVFLNGGFGWAAVFVAVAVQPAVVEELAFRGIMLDSLRPLLTDTEAVLVTALLFMILHLAPAMFPHTFVMGLAAGWLRVRTGSLLPCIMLHFTHNALCVVQEWATA